MLTTEPKSSRSMTAVAELRWQEWDPRIFDPEPMKLKDALLAIDLIDRMNYDPRQRAVFYNFDGPRVRTSKVVEDIRRAAEDLCAPIGARVAWSTTTTSRSTKA